MQDGGLATANGFSSARYWEERYPPRGAPRVPGHTAGSLPFKAAFVNGFLAMNNISRVIEFGCGDGNQLSLLSVPHYTGVDVSATVLERCRTRFPGHVFHGPDGLDGIPSAQLGPIDGRGFPPNRGFGVRGLHAHPVRVVVGARHHLRQRHRDTIGRPARPSPAGNPLMSAGHFRTGRWLLGCQMPIRSIQGGRMKPRFRTFLCSAAMDGRPG